MLTLAANICTEEFRPLWNVVGIIINVVWIGVPILLIVLGSIDLGKAVMAGDEKEIKELKIELREMEEKKDELYELLKEINYISKKI